MPNADPLSLILFVIGTVAVVGGLTGLVWFLFKRKRR